MVKKIAILVSLLLVLAVIGSSCTPRINQTELKVKELESRVQALSTSLEWTQQQLLAAEAAIRNVQ